jgi:hypothetical protein
MSDVINGVPRELLRHIAEHLQLDACGSPCEQLAGELADKLSALLTAQPQASAAQSAPVETDAFVPGSLADLLFQLGEKGVGVSGGTHGDRWRVRLPQTVTAQSAPAGECEAYEQACRERAASNGRVYEDHYFKRSAETGDYLNPSAEHGWQVWQQARAAWKRTQSAANDSHDFKNFHRLLCERFGYTHDEKDWRRDQLSLIEWIAKQSAGVPNVSAMARVLSDRSADACNIDRTDNWAMYGQEYIEDVQAMLAAATAQPAARKYGSYTTQPGESVSGIALRQLKDKSRWVEIRDLNAHAFPDIGPHDYYPVGTVLTMPAAQDESDER